jgi:hypothetical protein
LILEAPTLLELFLFDKFDTMKIAIYILLFLSSSLMLAQEKSNWSIEAHGGIPFNIPLPLSIHQNGQKDITFIAHFNSEPFTPPVFWVYRFSKWKNDKAWEFEMIHQKLYLKNPPKEIQYFSITHGYNLLMFNRAVKFNLFNEKEFIYRIGAGFVLAHAENMVRGKELNQQQSFFDKGYYIGGPVINLAIAKQFKISSRFYFNTEIKNNTSFARVPVVDGHALVWHSAFEIIGGLGIYLIKR